MAYVQQGQTEKKKKKKPTSCIKLLMFIYENEVSVPADRRDEATLKKKVVFH